MWLWGGGGGVWRNKLRAAEGAGQDVSGRLLLCWAEGAGLKVGNKSWMGGKEE